jgi:hypothetical protein
VPLTEELMLKQKRMSRGGKQRGPPTTAMAFTSGSIEDVEEEEEAEKSNIVGAVMPAAALGIDSESDSDMSIPLSEKHLRDCKINDGCTTATVTGMLDTGAHIALIDKNVVKRLQLKIHKLKKALPITVALNDSTTHRRYLDSYVFLSVTSTDNVWNATRTRFLVTSSLCTSILFGLPWLKRNRIVIDVERRSAINKDSGYNLLQPAESQKPAKCIPAPLRRRKDLKFMRKIKDLKVEAMKELLEKGKYRRKEGRGMSRTTIAALIRERIESLASREELEKEERDIKREFKDVFEPIPHVDELPGDVRASINLKDATKTIATRTYACPRKFREAWKILIQQHLDTGRI